MKRFGIFRKFGDGSRAFVTTSEDESSAKTTAILLKEQTGSDHLVFNLKTNKGLRHGAVRQAFEKVERHEKPKLGAKIALKNGGELWMSQQDNQKTR